MSIKICRYCGKEFEGSGRSSYCPGPHFAICSVCGKEFEVDPRNPSKCCSVKCKSELRKQSISSKVRICELCGETFTSSSNTSRYCDRDHYRPCPVCGKPVLVERGKEYEDPKCCSSECTRALRQRTCKTKYGVDVVSKSEAVRSKLRDSAIASSERRKETSLKNWGVDNPSKSHEVRSKISATIRSDECQTRMRSTTRKRYGVDFAMQSPKGLEKYSTAIQEKYGVPYFCMTDKCKDSQGHIISSMNRAFGKLLSNQGISYNFELRLDDKSFDIHLDGTNILIELNPTYTHNSIGNHWTENGLDSNYHLIKTQTAQLHGYRCIHVFDWDDVEKVISLVQPKHVIYARNCVIKEVDRNECYNFLDVNHLQGSCNGQSIRLGLYYNDKLVQIMTFGKPRYNSKYEWELLRLCTDSRYSVVGGASKLFNNFLKLHCPNSIISYCDISKFTGSVYEKIGMSLHHTTSPNKVWSRGQEHITNNLLLMRGYDQLFGTNYGKGESNERLMIENGWLPVYDCGQNVYTWTK